MEGDGGPQRTAAVIDPGQHRPRHEVLQHQQKIRHVLVHHGELPHVQQGEQGAGHHIGHRPALALQVAEHQAPEQHLLHKGRQEHHDEQRHVRGAVHLGGNGGVIEVGAVGDDEVRQPVGQLVEAVQGH